MIYKIKPVFFKIKFFLVILFFLMACGDKKKPDVTGIDVSVNIQRFDQDLSTLKPEDIALKLPDLQKKYSFFYTDYFEKILSTGSVDSTAFIPVVKEIISGKPFQDLQEETNKVFPDLKQQERAIADAFKYIKFYYPQKKLPKLVSYISGFQVQTPIGPDYIGIGLDMFLGANSKFYPALRNTLPQYITNRFTPDNITPRVIEVMAREEMFPERDEDKALLNKMIYQGKMMYFLQSVMPNAKEELLIGYTEKQLKWCIDNEPLIWAYFLDENLLYDTDYLKIQKYLSEAPFTPGLGEKNDSAPKLGIWTGWQIIKSYMDKNSDVTLQQLMANTDAQQILNAANYRPKAK